MLKFNNNNFCRHLSFLFELEVFPVEPEGGDGVLGRVMGDSLDPRVQEMPGQELERHPPEGSYCLPV